MKKMKIMGSSSSSSSIKRVDRKDITDDVWFEIFLHLSFSAVFKFRCVSKVWFSILSNPNFIKKWYRLNYLSLPWGLFQYAYPGSLENQDNNKLRRYFTIAYPDSHSKFISHHQTGFSFSFLNSILQNRSSSNDHQGRTDLFVVGSSGGLVLCTTRRHPTTYYVCNPLSEKWVVLPPPPREDKWVVTGFICTSSLVSKSSYKVIHIPKFETGTKEFIVEMFSSELGEWNSYDVSCPQHITWKFSLSENLVAYNDFLHWCQKGSCSILAICVNGNLANHGTTRGRIECKLINMPDRAKDGDGDDDIDNLIECLGESEGFICFSRYNKMEKSLSVWVLDGDCWYTLHKDIKLHDWFAEIKSQSLSRSVSEIDLIIDIEVLGLSPVDKNVVILSSEKRNWAYNTKTRVYEPLCHPPMSTSATVLNHRLQCFLHFFRVTPESFLDVQI